MFENIIKKTETISSSPAPEKTTPMNDLKKATPEPARTPAPSKAETTILSTEAEFKGSVAFNGSLQLNGRLEGHIESDGGTLTIGETALVKAEIRANDIIVYGKVQGNIIGQGRVELRGKAQVYGDIRANRFLIEDGVTFVGKSETMAGRPEAQPDFSQMFTRLGSNSSKS